MPIEHSKGGTTLTGDSIDYFRLCTIMRGVGLELKGLRMSRGRTCYAIAKESYGLKGSKQSVYEQLCVMVEEAKRVQEHRVTDELGREIREVGGREVN